MKELLQNYANSLRGAEAYFREDWDVVYFSLLGKCFGLLSETSITLKGNPTTNIQLRDTYSVIVPGYHMNKKHWNTISIDINSLPVEFLKSLIEDSYHLVYNNLSKRDKEIVDESPVRDFK